MERTSDTRTIAPNLMYRKPWEFKLGLNSSIDWGNYKQATVQPQATWYQNFCDKSWWAYYIDTSYRYQKVGDAQAKHRAKATLRGDFSVYRFSEDWKLSIGAFATEVHDTGLKLDSRITGGAGPWFNYDNQWFENGFSVFPVIEHEVFKSSPQELAGRLSLRNISILKIEDKARFILDGYYVPNFKKMKNDWRASISASAEIKLWKSLSGTATVGYEYDSLPKAGVKNEDGAFILGLSYAIGAEEKKPDAEEAAQKTKD